MTNLWQSASIPQPKKSPKMDRKRKVIDIKAEYAARMLNEKEKLRLVVVGMLCDKQGHTILSSYITSDCTSPNHQSLAKMALENKNCKSRSWSKNKGFVKQKQNGPICNRPC